MHPCHLKKTKGMIPYFVGVGSDHILAHVENSYLVFSSNMVRHLINIFLLSISVEKQWVLRGEHHNIHPVFMYYHQYCSFTPICICISWCLHTPTILMICTIYIPHDHFVILKPLLFMTSSYCKFTIRQNEDKIIFTIFYHQRINSSCSEGASAGFGRASTGSRA
jgi:hypothetical protein